MRPKCQDYDSIIVLIAEQIKDQQLRPELSSEVEVVAGYQGDID
jgi:hypothetical protein